MNIILGEQAAQQAGERYVVLELDQFRVAGHPDVTTAYCVLEHVSLEEIPQIPELRSWHRDLIRAFRDADWDTCDRNLQRLRGHWNQELDSFYDHIDQRMQQQRQQPESSWDPILDRQPA